MLERELRPFCALH